MFLTQNISKYQKLDSDQVNNLAQLIWFKINQNPNKQSLDNIDLVPIIQRLYKPMNPNFQPANNDITNYKRVLDRNSDGVVTFDDIVDLVKRYCSSDPKFPRSLEETDRVSINQPIMRSSSMIPRQSNLVQSNYQQPQQQQYQQQSSNSNNQSLRSSQINQYQPQQQYHQQQYKPQQQQLQQSVNSSSQKQFQQQQPQQQNQQTIYHQTSQGVQLAHSGRSQQ
ncbi:hypothetical protein PPERSA_02941 [Pseudocohnilembus persalinus]|uniref:EF-hand domain-containing protein n=1 Tax=Pseudocohnilembus persalinus TaxID=266149 RepID=A0A0V0QA79_PSEPJ|nr:hypothetical protein PPERSA_02941 [Pseudocohnilembus persalinus]|eukprot:KRW99109.1 hypothetical protein PPERSA_02941 [Pseudocohnilembus persalinus]